MRDVLLVGAGRGLGYELARIFAQEATVWHTTHSSPPVASVGPHFSLDLRDEKQMRCVTRKLKSCGASFDVVMFVGAKTPNLKEPEIGVEFSSGLSREVFLDYFNVNCLGPLLFFELIYAERLVKPSAKVVFFSSLAGSVELRGTLPHHKKGGNLAYRISKSALNSGVRNIAFDLSYTRADGVIVAAIHPGWVRTDSGGLMAEIDVVSAAERVAALVGSLGDHQHGNFLFTDGSVVPW